MNRSPKRLRRRPSRANPVQLALDFARRRGDDGRGGRRDGAGRQKSPRSRVPHRVRPPLSRHHPVHVTLRLRKDAQGVRSKNVFKLVRRALARAKEQFGFRLNHYAVQGNHIHIIAEANDRRALARGMMGLTIRVALAVNRVRGRKGRVFGDRYHARQLKTPLEVRRALLYVLRNERHHLAARGLSLPPWQWDACSSAREFDGWRDDQLLALALAREQSALGSRSSPEPSVVAPVSYLLKTGWRRHGLLGLDEEPGPG